MQRKRIVIKPNSQRQRFAEALDYAIRARGLSPNTINPIQRRQIAAVVRSTMNTTGALKK